MEKSASMHSKGWEYKQTKKHLSDEIEERVSKLETRDTGRGALCEC